MLQCDINVKQKRECERKTGRCGEAYDHSRHPGYSSTYPRRHHTLDQPRDSYTRKHLYPGETQQQINTTT